MFTDLSLSSSFSLTVHFSFPLSLSLCLSVSLLLREYARRGFAFEYARVHAPSMTGDLAMDLLKSRFLGRGKS